MFRQPGGRRAGSTRDDGELSSEERGYDLHAKGSRHRNAALLVDKIKRKNPQRTDFISMGCGFFWRIGPASLPFNDETSITYTAAQQIADRGSPLGPGGSLDIRIFQISALLGRGAPKASTLFF